GGGAIVNMSSIHAHETTPGSAAYVCTKAGLEGLTRAMAVELAPKRVRVNAVVPGVILSYAGTEARDDSGLAKKEEESLRRIEEVEGLCHQPWPVNGTPGDVANLIAFLLSEASSFISGTCIAIDGGLSADVRTASAKAAAGHEEMEKIRAELRKLGLPT